MKKFRPEVLIAVIAVVVVAGAMVFATMSAKSGDAQTSSSSNASSSSTLPKAKLDKLTLPQLSDTVAKNESEVVMHTSMGDITMKLFNKYAPLAVENFVTHAKDGYYNNTTFHRVIKDFMIQGGDPKGDGTGGESIWNGKDSKIDSGNGFENEISPSLYNIRGALSMANAGPDTNGSQFFINQNSDDVTNKISAKRYPEKIYEAYKKGGNPTLDGSYTVFGQVISGMDVVDKIASVSTDDSDKPTETVTVTSVEVVKDASSK
ncbi:peptidylprolyl isomerase [Weissella sp. GP1]|uniref:Peptidyl-prolyl cis-trans isomerase n=1 Tax=Weissella confusa TaxID=1583 RepID=A0AAJ2YYT1_WEICO|nr:peptidylprolyl isomerase [Weissella confusa]MBJ7695575.1 peptidylprolyl isomerase [Weissella confusa]NBA12460.1 peptidylprolyl isomerase [Weissella confusa]QBZ05301.1 peptidylprolyl isomerase [Weissella confusa]